MLIALLGCASNGELPADPATDACATAPDYAEADAFLTTWCTACHGTMVVGAARHGAPVGLNLDSADGVSTWAASAAGAVGDGRMPPAGGPTEAERASFVAWVGCDLPGLPPVEASADPCGLPSVRAGDLHAAEQPCAGVAGLVVVGDLVVDAAADLTCVCAVEGDLRCDLGSSAALGRLETVLGDVDLSSCEAVSLPGLTEVGGELRAVDTGLRSVTAPALLAVGGELRLARGPALTSLDFVRLQTVGASLVLDDLDLLAGVDTWSALASVGGDLTVRGSALFDGVAPLLGLEVVGGKMRVENLTGLTVWDGTPRLRLAPAVHVEGADALASLDALDAWSGGDLALVKLGALGAVPSAPLASAMGEVVLSDLPALADLSGLAAMTQASRVELSRCAAVTTLAEWTSLEEIAGDLVIQDLPALTEIGLPALLRVDGDVVLRDLPSLSLADALDFLDGLSVGGVATVDGLE